LALPDHAWPQRRRGRLGAKLLAACVIIFALFLATGSFFGRYRFPAFSAYSNVGQSVLWIVIGLALWKRDLGYLRRAIGALLIFRGASQIGVGLWGMEPGFRFMRLVELGSLLAVGYGVLSAKEWGRRGCIVLGLASYGLTLASAASAYQWRIIELPPFDPSMWVFFALTIFLGIAGPSLALAFYGAHRSTRRQFADDRTALMQRREAQSPLGG